MVTASGTPSTRISSGSSIATSSLIPSCSTRCESIAADDGGSGYRGAVWAFVPVPLMAVVVAAIVGRNVRAGDGRWASPQLIFLTLAAAVAGAVAAASGIDPDVGTSDAVTGVILAAVLGAPPVV